MIKKASVFSHKYRFLNGLIFKSKKSFIKSRDFFYDLSENLWGDKFDPWVLGFIAIILLFFLLGGRDLWTQETRWANTCQQMLIRHDFLHPYLGDKNYYDKPILSYWIVIFFSYIFGLGRWALRFPSAISGLICIWCSYKICSNLTNRRTGIIAAWMLCTTVFFIYWARVSSADMLNSAGTLLAATFFILKRDKLNFINFFIIFFIIVFTALCKGLVSPVVAGLMVLPILIKEKKWKEYFKPSMFVALIICIILYILPFYISSVTDPSHYKENGLYEVFRENIVRYFHPFDHEAPIYIYFVYLPLYSAPWILFTLIGLWSRIKNWSKINFASKYYIIMLALVFVFFTASGSRRSYYVLPLVPLAIIVAADYVNFAIDQRKHLRSIVSFFIVLAALVVLIMNIIIGITSYGGGSYKFASDFKQETSSIKPLDYWNLVYIGVDDERSPTFYIGQNKLPIVYEYDWKHFSGLSNLPVKISATSNNVIIVPRSAYEKHIEKAVNLSDFLIIQAHSDMGDWLSGKVNKDELITALVPLK